MKINQIKISASSILAILSLVSVIFLWENNLLLAFVLLLIGIITLFLWRKKRHIYLYIIAGVLGATAESIAIGFGAWNYSNPTFLNIPLWLPLLWGEAALFISTLMLELKELEK